MEATYKAVELAAQARQLFGTSPEVVSVALRMADRKTATVTEAQAIVRDFLEREVR